MDAKNYLKYRSVWMGIAMLWIAWDHSLLNIPVFPLNFIKEIGYGGVDICLFASGLGCYFSLSKDSDSGKFIKRRFSRVYPTYVCFIWIWILYQIIIKGEPMPKQAILGNLLGIQYLTTLGHHFNWYISAIFLLYILAPYFKSLVDSVKGNWSQAILIGMLILLSVPFWNARKFIIIMTRIPIFVMGMLMGKKCSERSRISGREMVIQILAAVVGSGWLLINMKYFQNRLWNYGLYWYPFILITPGICIVVSFIASILDKYKIGRCIVHAMDIIGQYSLEVYLVHVLVFNMTKHMIEGKKAIPNTVLVWICAVAGVIVGCAVLRYMVQRMRSLVGSVRK